MEIRLSHPLTPRKDEGGQAIVLVLLALGIFLLAMTALAVDFTNLWFHRQNAQSAADSACVAGVVDMLAKQNNPTFVPTGLTIGTGATCSATSTEAPCVYAKKNGYSSPGLTANTESNSVTYSFPTGTCPNGSDCPVPGVTPSALTAFPFIKTVVLDRVGVYFMGLLSGSRTVDVQTAAVCGVSTQKVTPSIALLAPTGNDLDVSGSSFLTVAGGTNLTLTANSSDPAAITNEGTAAVNFVYGGSDYCGGQLLVFGGPSTPIGGWVTSCPGTGCPSPAPTCATPRPPKWVSPGGPITDPFTALSAPTTAVTGATVTKMHNEDGCPDTQCTEYLPGTYPGGITVKNQTAIFVPGTYVVTGGLSLDANSCVRPTIGPTGEGIGGTIFYFTDQNTVSVGANGGQKCSGLDPFDITTNEKCSASTIIPSFVPASTTGNVLLAPCTGTYGDPTGNNADRGVLFFQNRSQGSQAPNKPAMSFQGGGSLLFVGAVYVHQCTVGTSGTADPGPNASCVSGAFTSHIDFHGDPGSSTLIVGNIITDILSTGGNSQVTMSLNKLAPYFTNRAGLLR